MRQFEGIFKIFEVPCDSSAGVNRKSSSSIGGGEIRRSLLQLVAKIVEPGAGDRWTARNFRDAFKVHAHLGGKDYVEDLKMLEHNLYASPVRSVR